MREQGKLGWLTGSMRRWRIAARKREMAKFRRKFGKWLMEYSDPELEFVIYGDNIAYTEVL